MCAAAAREAEESRVFEDEIVVVFMIPLVRVARFRMRPLPELAHRSAERQLAALPGEGSGAAHGNSGGRGGKRGAHRSGRARDYNRDRGYRDGQWCGCRIR